MRNRDTDELEWKACLATLTDEQRTVILHAAIKRLIECEEVSWRQRNFGDIGVTNPEWQCEPCLYWDACGESLLEGY